MIARVATVGAGAEVVPAEEAACRAVRELAAIDHLPGVSLAVFAEGRVAVSEAFGWASLDPPRAAGITSRFRVASVSKALKRSPVVARLRLRAHTRKRITISAACSTIRATARRR